MIALSRAARALAPLGVVSGSVRALSADLEADLGADLGAARVVVGPLTRSGGEYTRLCARCSIRPTLPERSTSSASGVESRASATSTVISSRAVWKRRGWNVASLATALAPRGSSGIHLESGVYVHLTLFCEMNIPSGFPSVSNTTSRPPSPSLNTAPTPVRSNSSPSCASVLTTNAPACPCFLLTCVALGLTMRRRTARKFFWVSSVNTPHMYGKSLDTFFLS